MACTEKGLWLLEVFKLVLRTRESLRGIEQKEDFGMGWESTRGEFTKREAIWLRLVDVTAIAIVVCCCFFFAFGFWFFFCSFVGVWVSVVLFVGAFWFLVTTFFIAFTFLLPDWALQLHGLSLVYRIQVGWKFLFFFGRKGLSLD